MTLQLSITNRSSGTTHHITLNADAVTLGRSKNCHVQIPLSTVSSHHLTFRRHGEDYVLEDAGSTNGTTLDGRTLSPHRPTILHNDARIDLLDVSIHITITKEMMRDDGFTLEESATMMRQMVQDALMADKRLRAAEEDPTAPYFELTFGPHILMGRKWHLMSAWTHAWMGAAPEAPLAIAALQLPRKWLILERKGDDWLLKPHITTQEPSLINGTILNSAHTLTHQDTLTYKDLALTYQDPLASYLEALGEDVLPSPQDFNAHEQHEHAKAEPKEHHAPQEKLPKQNTSPDNNPIPKTEHRQSVDTKEEDATHDQKSAHKQPGQPELPTSGGIPGRMFLGAVAMGSVAVAVFILLVMFGLLSFEPS